MLYRDLYLSIFECIDVNAHICVYIFLYILLSVHICLHLFICVHFYVCMCIVKMTICLRGVEGSQTLPNVLQVSTCIYLYITMLMYNTIDDVGKENKASF
jgi:hypothetical protein